MWNTNLCIEVFNRFICMHFLIQIPEDILLTKLKPSEKY